MAAGTAPPPPPRRRVRRTRTCRAGSEGGGGVRRRGKSGGRRRAVRCAMDHGGRARRASGSRCFAGEALVSVANPARLSRTRTLNILEKLWLTAVNRSLGAPREIKSYPRIFSSVNICQLY